MADSKPYSIDATDVQQALQRIQPLVHRTPVLTCKALDGMAGRELFFKAEALQKTGSFKIRGALNAAMQVAEGVPVVTHSSGNHAQALALAAQLTKRAAHIVMPNNAPAVKKEAVIGYGANVSLCEPTNAARAAAADAKVAETAGHLVHPSDDVHVMAGQGTLAIEFMEDVAGLDCLVVPLGGGGLISGVATAAKAINPNILIVGAEPANADDAFRSKAAGRILGHEQEPETVADGLKTLLGGNNFPIIRDKVDRIVLVQEHEILEGMKLVWGRMKVCIEPSAGTGVAAVLSEEFQRECGHCQRVGVILCGGNIDLAKAAKLLSPL